MSAAATIRSVFRDAGVHGCVYARAVGADDREFGLDADEPMALASLYKLVVLVTYSRAVDDGVLRPASRITLRRAARTTGPSGIGALNDDVTLSWRDVATLMIAASDNACGDALFSRLGNGRIDDTLERLELTATRINGGADDQIKALMRATHTKSETAAIEALGDPDRDVEPASYDPRLTSHSTAREITALLNAIWTGRAASAGQCAFARRALDGVIGPYRLRLGFPNDAVRIAHKTGSLGALRHDAGVLTMPDGQLFAVTVLTRAARSKSIMIQVDAAIGRAARIAIDELRRP